MRTGCLYLTNWVFHIILRPSTFSRCSYFRPEMKMWFCKGLVAYNMLKKMWKMCFSGATIHFHVSACTWFRSKLFTLGAHIVWLPHIYFGNNACKSELWSSLILGSKDKQAGRLHCCLPWVSHLLLILVCQRGSWESQNIFLSLWHPLHIWAKTFHLVFCTEFCLVTEVNYALNLF